MDEPPAPWVAIPGLSPNDPATQGEAAAFYDLHWVPFWMTLGAEQKAAYLDRWHAAPEWRDAIARKYDGDGLDLAEDLQDSEEALERYKAERASRSMLKRWFGVR